MSGRRKENAAARNRKSNGGNANKKGTRAIMTSNQERPQPEIRNSARAICAPDFEFRFSSFEWKITPALHPCLGPGRLAAARLRGGTRLGKAL